MGAAEGELDRVRTGKTLLLESLGQQAIDEGMFVSCLSLEDLGVLVRRHRIDDSVNKAINRVTNVDLICIDDIGLLPVSGDAAEGFYRVVEASYEKRFWQSARTSIPQASTSSCRKRSPPRPWTGLCTTRTCAKPAASPSGSFKSKTGKEPAR